MILRCILAENYCSAMLVNVTGAKCIGIDAVPVTVEVDVILGIGIHLVGLADTAVKESLLRTITALQALGYRIPGRKIVINLAPAAGAAMTCPSHWALSPLPGNAPSLTSGRISLWESSGWTARCATSQEPFLSLIWPVQGA